MTRQAQFLAEQHELDHARAAAAMGQEQLEMLTQANLKAAAGGSLATFQEWRGNTFLEMATDLKPFNMKAFAMRGEPDRTTMLLDLPFMASIKKAPVSKLTSSGQKPGARFGQPSPHLTSAPSTPTVPVQMPVETSDLPSPTTNRSQMRTRPMTSLEAATKMLPLPSGDLPQPKIIQDQPGTPFTPFEKAMKFISQPKRLDISSSGAGKSIGIAGEIAIMEKSPSGQTNSSSSAPSSSVMSGVTGSISTRTSSSVTPVTPCKSIFRNQDLILTCWFNR